MMNTLETKPTDIHKHARKKRSQSGLTLLEMLIAMAIMGVLMLAFTQLFGGTLRASSNISARNELLSEGQIAQQLMTSRLKQASTIYPSGTNFTLTNTTRTYNTLRGTQDWTVGTDPIIAMLVPPEGSNNPAVTTCSPSAREMCFTFYAYYPVRRGFFMENENITPAPDPANDDTWLIMEYRKKIDNDPVDRSANRLASPPSLNRVRARLGGVVAQILVDYVQPPGNDDPDLFDIRSDGSVELNMQMGRKQGGKTLELSPLSVRVYPRNAPDALP